MKARREADLRKLYNQTTDVVILFNWLGEITEANRSFLKIFGYSLDDISTLSFHDILSESEIASLADTFKLLKKRTIYKGVWKFKRKDSSVFMSDLVVRKFNSELLLATIREDVKTVSEEEPLKFSIDRYIQTLDHLVEGCQIIGFDWRYIYLNSAAELYNGRPNNELIGRRYEDVWPDAERTDIYSHVKLCMEQRISLHLEKQLSNPDGSYKKIDFNFRPVPEGVFILSIESLKRKRALKP